MVYYLASMGSLDENTCTRVLNLFWLTSLQSPLWACISWFPSRYLNIGFVLGQRTYTVRNIACREQKSQVRKLKRNARDSTMIFAPSQIIWLLLLCPSRIIQFLQPLQSFLYLIGRTLFQTRELQYGLLTMQNRVWWRLYLADALDIPVQTVFAAKNSGKKSVLL